MSLLCTCFTGRSRIQLPSDDLRHPPPRFMLHVEPKTHTPRAALSSRYRLTRTASSNPDQSLSAHLLSEKETPLLLEETEVVEEEETEDSNDSASNTSRMSHASSTVTLPSTRITSIASTLTGASRLSRVSDDGAEPPPYTPPMRRVLRTSDEIDDIRSAGDLYRDIQQRIADAGCQNRN